MHDRKPQNPTASKKRRLLHETLESRHLLAADWRNPADQFDVNADQNITALDALQVINELNRRDGDGTLDLPYSEGRPYVDVNGDRVVAPIDALQVINYLNRNTPGERTQVDNGRLVVEQSTLVTVGETSGKRLYRLEIEGSLGRGGAGGASADDVLAIYLVDADDSSKSLLGGTDGEMRPLFSMTATGVRTIPGLSRWDGASVLLDLSGITGTETGRLVLQTINRNGLNDSALTFRLLENQVTDTVSEGELVLSPREVVAAGGAIDVNSFGTGNDTSVIERLAYYDSSRQTLVSEVAIQNGSQAIGGTAIISFPGLPDGVTLLNRSGVDGDGVPYINAAPALPGGGLAARAASRFVEVQFEASPGVAFELMPVVKLGQPNRAPTIDAIAPITIRPGEVETIPVITRDADGDAVSLSLAGNGALPTGGLTAQQQLVLRPTLEDVGTYTITLIASDGAESSKRDVQVHVVADTLGTTRVSGQILDVDQTPLESLQLELSGVVAVTDGDGRFTIDLGTQALTSNTLRIRGDLFGDQATYPFIAEKLPLLLERDVLGGVNNVIDRPIYLPKLDAGTDIDPQADTMVTNPLLEGTELLVQAGTLLNQQGTPFSGQLSVTEVPAAFTPAALPPGLAPDVVVTVQPGEMVFTQPTPLSLPNLSGWAPGTEMDLWSINPTTGEFDNVGMGVVSADGSVVETVQGGVRTSSWHFFNIPADPRGDIKAGDSPQQSDPTCNANPTSCNATSSVDLFTGSLTEVHNVVGYQSQGVYRGVQLVYDSLRADPRPIVHGGYNNIAGDSDLLTRIEVARGDFRYVVPGYSGPASEGVADSFPDLQGGEHFFRSPSETGSADFALQLDLREFETGLYDYTMNTGRTQRWEQSVCTTGTMIVNGQPVCGTQPELVDRISFATREVEGQLVHVNTTDSPYGAGWGIGGLLSLVENPDGSVLMIDGDGEEQLFEPPQTSGSAYINPPGQFGTLLKQPSGNFSLRLTDQSELRFDDKHQLAQVVDRNGNLTRYEYNVAGALTSIIDPVGLQTSFAYQNGYLFSITDPANRVTRFEYDTAGNLTRIIEPDDSARTFFYDDGHRMVGEEDQLGRRETAVFDRAGRVVEAIRKDGTSIRVMPVDTQALVTDFDTTDPNNPAPIKSLPTAEAIYVDANGSAMSFSLDRGGQTEASRDSEGGLGGVIRDGRNLILEQNSARGNKSEFTYDDRGNLLTSSDQLSTGSAAISGTLENEYDRAIYTFDVTEAQSVYIDSFGANELNITVSGPSGTLFTRRADGEVYNTIPFLAAGQYTVTLESIAERPQSYRFEILAFSDATTVQTGSTISGAVGGQAEIYRLQGQPGDLVNLRRLISGSDATIRVIDGAGNEVNGRTTQDIENVTLPRSGDLFLVIEHFGGSSSADELAEFSVAIEWVTNTPFAPFGGGALELGAATSGSLSAAGDVVSYTFGLQETESFYFDARTNANELRWDLEGPYGEVLTNQSFTSTPSSSQLQQLRLLPGDYQLRIYAVGSNPFGGQFPASFDFALLDFGSASDFSTDAVVSDRSIVGGSKAYRFDGESGRTMFFDVRESENMSNASWRLISPSGNVVFNTSFRDTQDIVLTEDGTHTLIVEGYRFETESGDYSFFIETLPVESPRSLQFDLPVTGAIDIPGQTVSYAFSLQESEDLYLDGIADNSSIRWSLVGPSGTVFHSSSVLFQLSNATVEALQNLPPGDYELVIDGSGTATGEFQFTLATLSDLPLSPGDTSISATIAAGRSVLYALDLDSENRYFFDLMNATNQSGTDWRLIDPFGRVVFRNSISDQRTRSIDVSGRYTLAIENDASLVTDDANLEFSIQTVAPEIPTDLTLGGIVEGSIAIPGGTREYIFELSEESSLYFDDRDSSQVSTSFRWSLLGPGDIELAPNYFSNSDTDGAVRSLQSLPSGQYRLTIDAASNATGEFSFRLIDLGSAVSITPGTPVTGTIDAGAVLAFQFDANRDDRFFFDVQSAENLGSATWKVHDPSGFEVFDRHFTDQEIVTVPADGTYTLILNDYRYNTEDGTFTFDVRPVGPITPVPLTLNALTTGSIDIPGDVVLYEFELDQPRQLVFNSPTTLSSDPYLEWSLAGPTVDSNRDYYFGSSISEFVFNQLDLPIGSYQLTVDSRFLETGSFEFALVDAATSPLVTLDTPTTVELPARQTNVHRFEATQGERYFFDFQGGDQLHFNTNWQLYDPSGNRVFDQSLGDVDVIDVELDGVYTLLVENYFRADEDGSYTFAIQELGDVTSTAIQIGDVVDASLERPGESDRFTFSLAEPAILYFDSLSHTSDAPTFYWGMEGPMGLIAERRSSTSMPSDLATFILPAGDYTLNVDSAFSSQGDYQFQLSDLRDASSIVLGDTVSGTLEARSTLAYQIDVAAGDTVALDALSLEIAGAASWRLLNPNMDQVFSTSFGNDREFEAEFGGTFLLLIEGDSDETSDSDFSFSTSLVSSDPPSALTGVPLDQAQKIEGSISVTGEVDSYLFTLSQASSVYFDSLANETTMYWQLIGPRGELGNRVAFVSGMSTNVLESLQNLVPGQYQLNISSTSSGTGTYAFQFLNLADAPAIDFGDTVVGKLSGSETDAYRFSADNGDRFLFSDLSASPPDSSYLRLLDPFGRVLSDSRIHSQTFSDRDVVDLPYAGSYTLLIERSFNRDTAPDYSFRLESVPAPSSASLVLGEVTSGRIDVPGDWSQHTFTLTDPTQLYFDGISTLSSQPNFYWQLESRAGTVVSRRDFASSLSTSVAESLMLEAGDYTLTVDAWSQQTGDYAFRLFDVATAPTIQLDTVVSGTLSPRTVDSYKFMGSQGQQVWFDFGGSDGISGTDWLLFDPHGQQIFDRGFAYDAPVLSLPSSGDYTLLIDGNSQATADGTYSFQVRTLAPQPSQILTLGDLVNGTLRAPEDVAEYTILLDDYDQLIFDGISTLGSDQRFNWELRHPSGQVISSRRFTSLSDTALESLRLSPGKYTLSITAQSLEFGDFQFRMLGRNNALRVPRDTVVVNELPPRQSKSYRIDGTAGDRIHIDFVPVDGAEAASWRLIDPHGNVVQTDSVPDSHVVDLSIDGDYVLLVESNDNATASSRHDFTVRTIEAVAETEIVFGEKVSGRIDVPGDRQRFLFSLSEPTPLYFDAITTLPAAPDFYWELDGPSDFDVSRRWFQTSLTTSTLEGLRLPAGDYAITIDAGLEDIGDFEFQLLSYESAEIFLAGTQVTGTLAARETELHQFQATKGERYFFNAFGADDVDANWRLIDPFGDQIFGRSFGDSDAFTLSADGTYTLILESDGNVTEPADYSFRLQPTITTGPIAINDDSEGGITFTYDSVFSQPTSMIDELGRQTIFALDPANGNRLSTRQVVGAIDTGPDGDDLVTTYTYTESGLLETTTDPLGRVVRYDYDARENLTRVTVALGTADQAVTRYEYDAIGNQTAIIDPNGNRTEYQYDPMNRVTRIIEADPDDSGSLTSPTSTFEYDARGNLTSTTDAEESTIRYVYDARDQMVEMRDELDQVTRYVYDPAGNVREVIDPRGQRTVNRYDARNRLTQTTDPDGGVTRFQYDGDDNLIGLVDPVGNETKFVYDARNRLIEEIDPLGHSILYVYDANNNLIQKTDRNNRVTEFVYNDLDRLVEENWIDVDGTTIVNTINYAYDKVGNLLEVDDLYSHLTYTYDSLNRVETVSNAGTPDAPVVVLTYAYDAIGNVISVSDVIDGVSGATTSYDYDALNRMIGIQQSGNDVSDKAVDFVYNQIGQFDEISRYSDLARTALVAKTDYEYDNLNRLTDLDHTNAADEVLAFYDYQYDAASRITQIADIDGITNYSYDDRSQLTGADRGEDDIRGDESYAYDANGNRISSHRHDDGYETGPANRLLSDGTYDYEYDNEGNMIRRTEIASGDYRAYHFNHRNRLVRIVDFSSGGTIVKEIDYAYDTRNRRIARTVNTRGQVAGGGLMEVYVYDREDVLLDFVIADSAPANASPELSSRYTHGLGIDQILALENGGGASGKWVIADHLGTTRGLINDDGGVLNRLSYDSFGNLVSQTEPAISTRYQFTGRESDAIVGMHYYRARFYDSQTGLFLTEDEIGFAVGNTNNRAYSYNNPISYTDPLGLDSFLVCRPLGGDSKYFDHCFVVANSSGPGTGDVYSYGQQDNGRLGPVNASTQNSQSATTYATDVAAWNSGNVDVTMIPATDSNVQIVATTLIPDQDYAALGIGGANSNSAALAVANQAIQLTYPGTNASVTLPGDRSKPGQGSADEVSFFQMCVFPGSRGSSNPQPRGGFTHVF